MKEANTVEAIIELVRQQDAALSRRLWSEIEARIAALAQARVPAVRASQCVCSTWTAVTWELA
jgi:cobalt-precorrin-5B (C1)-methyltransferase